MRTTERYRRAKEENFPKCTNCWRAKTTRGVFCPECKAVINARHKERYRRVRQLVIDYYGGPTCKCCQRELAHEDCQIDHVHGAGTQHRKQIRQNNLTLWLYRNGFPPGFQILCKGCNAMKGSGPRCPCQDEIRRLAPISQPPLQQDGSTPIQWL